MTQKLVIIGASNALREVCGIIVAINKAQPRFEVLGALDDDVRLHGREIAGVPVIGALDLAICLDGDVNFVFAIGSLGTQSIRDQVFNRLGVSRHRFPAIVHPKAEIDPTAHVGHGCIVHAGACIGPGSKLCDFVILAVNSALGPDALVKDFGMIASLVVILSRGVVGQVAFVGSMSCVLEDVEIGDFSRVGVGSVVNRDIPQKVIALGSPARILGNS